VFEADGDVGRGAITRFEHHADHDVAAGDATPAYGGKLTRAERTLVFLRPNLVIVHDALASREPRQWKWNIHALQQMRTGGDRAIRIRSGDATLCVDMHSDAAVEFVQTDRFSPPPREPNVPDQWHGAFVSKARSTTAEFVAVLRAGCTTPAVSMRRTECGWIADTGRKQVAICRGRISVEPSGSAASGVRPTLTGPGSPATIRPPDG
jgi:hypothetical protein